MESVKVQINEVVEKLSEDQQQLVLSFAQALGAVDVSVSQGVQGEVLLAHMDDFHFAPGELDEMSRVIEEECEKIDADEWQ